MNHIDRWITDAIARDDHRALELALWESGCDDDRALQGMGCERPVRLTAAQTDRIERFLDGDPSFPSLEQGA